MMHFAIAISLMFIVSYPSFAQETPAEAPVEVQAPPVVKEVATEAEIAPTEVPIAEVVTEENPVAVAEEPRAEEESQAEAKAEDKAEVATDAKTDKNSDAEAKEEKSDDGFYYDVAVLQGLNKVTARISELEAPVGTSVKFGNLDIVVKKCWKSPPSAQPENAARIVILERRPDEAPIEVFNGWMFSSSPSLSGLEHPVYDLIVLSCDKRKMGDNT